MVVAHNSALGLNSQAVRIVHPTSFWEYLREVLVVDCGCYPLVLAMMAQQYAMTTISFHQLVAIAVAVAAVVVVVVVVGYPPISNELTNQ